jgi:hypothetical protein
VKKREIKLGPINENGKQKLQRFSGRLVALYGASMYIGDAPI